MASVLIPGNIIGYVVRLSSKIIGADDEEEGEGEKKIVFDDDQLKNVKRFAPTLIGLCSIPFIIHPIDGSVDILLDNTLRVVFEKQY